MAAAGKKGGIQFWKEGKADDLKAIVNAATDAAGLGRREGPKAAPAAGSETWRKYLAGDSGSSRSLIADVLQFLLYAAVSLLILFVILTLIHFTVYPVFSFTPGDGGFIPVPVFSDSQKAAQSAANPPEEALDIQGIPTCGYSIAFDLKIPADFTNLQTPRVLLYRGTAAISSGGSSGTAPVNTSPPSATASKEVALKSYENYLNTQYTGTNIVVWLDPALNDLYVSAMTQTGTGTSLLTNIVTSDPVLNLPNNKTVRVAIVFTELFLEVYVDGRLRQTMTFKHAGNLKNIDTSTTNAKFFTTPKIAQQTVASPELKRISFWARPITAGEAMAGA